MLLYRYHDPGALGPMPDIYEPSWYPEKVLPGVAEGVAVVSATTGSGPTRRRGLEQHVSLLKPSVPS
jgi:hypothetical protein